MTMRKALLSIIALMSALAAFAQLQDRTLRVDYIFSGTDTRASISLASLSSFNTWAGRRVKMDKVPLKGNGQICMTDAASGQVLYRMSFSTLFQEWQATEEATRVTKAFENVFLLPMPSAPVNVTVELFDLRGRPAASLTHPVDPSDILIRPIGTNPPPTVDIHRSGSPADCIDIVMIPEGYTADELGTFLDDCTAAWESFMNHEPFSTLRDRFNVIAALIPSEQSGVSVPRQNNWKSTALESHFDTFYSDRYLTTLQLSRLHNLIAGLPYEHIIILANSTTYGGEAFTIHTNLPPRTIPPMPRWWSTNSATALPDSQTNTTTTTSSRNTTIPIPNPGSRTSPHCSTLTPNGPI